MRNELIKLVVKWRARLLDLEKRPENMVAVAIAETTAAQLEELEDTLAVNASAGFAWAGHIIHGDKDSVQAVVDMASQGAWFPIETAPNDIDILISNEIGVTGRRVTDYVPADENDYSWKADDGKRTRGVTVPTHWRTLPLPPEGDK